MSAVSSPTKNGVERNCFEPFTKNFVNVSLFAWTRFLNALQSMPAVVFGSQKNVRPLLLPNC